MPSTDDQILRLIPLGGLGDFGLNALVLEWADDLILLDAGVLYPGADLPGVDTIVPDFEYLRQRRGRLKAIVLSHGHEDHIGALAFALEAAPAPVYGSRLTLGLARQRLAERGLSAELLELVPGQATQAGPFRLHPIRVAHSIADSLALAIETPGGVVLASGDFKMRGGSTPEERTDVEALASWGQRGVLALLSDSTNVEHNGTTGSEDDVVPGLVEIFSRTKGRVIVSCFTASVPRIQRVADVARRFRRSVTFVGRRMVGNTGVALELGLLRVPSAGLVPAGSLAGTLPERQTLLVSGSQGEPLSALSAIAIGEHRDVTVGPGDSVVLSARVIPGNERGVSRLIGNLLRQGCDVFHAATAPVHVSGHGSREDLLKMLELVRPRYFVPIHGEYRMLAQHAKLALEAGLAPDRVLVAEDGDVLALTSERAVKAGRVAAGRVLLDRSRTDEIEDAVIRDRRHLSSEGIVVPVVVLDRETGRIEGTPQIVSRGFVDSGERADLMRRASRLVADTVESSPPDEQGDVALTRDRVRGELRRFFKRQTRRRPVVVTVVMEVDKCGVVGHG